jgi:antibiotic biosynthesis monooxygenase (ABM) superfamily enzyme
MICLHIYSQVLKCDDERHIAKIKCFLLGLIISMINVCLLSIYLLKFYSRNFQIWLVLIRSQYKSICDELHSRSILF